MTHPNPPAMSEKVESGEAPHGPWKRGYPPGKYYEGMTDDFEVYFTIGGYIWHRRLATPTPRDEK